MRGGQADHDARPETLRRQCEESLRRLGTDRVELYYLHAPDKNVPVAESAGAIRDLIAAGKVRAAGVSNVSAGGTGGFAAACPLAAFQPPYNMLQRQIEADTLPWCRRHGVSVLVYWPLVKGLLAGKIRRDEVFGRTTAAANIPCSRATSGRRITIWWTGCGKSPPAAATLSPISYQLDDPSAGHYRRAVRRTGGPINSRVCPWEWLATDGRAIRTDRGSSSTAGAGRYSAAGVIEKGEGGRGKKAESRKRKAEARTRPPSPDPWPLIPGPCFLAPDPCPRPQTLPNRFGPLIFTPLRCSTGSFSLPHRHDGVWFLRRPVLKWSVGERYAQVRGHNIRVGVGRVLDRVQHGTLSHGLGDVLSGQASEKALSAASARPEEPASRPPAPPPRPAQPPRKAKPIAVKPAPVTAKKSVAEEPRPPLLSRKMVKQRPTRSRRPAISASAEPKPLKPLVPVTQVSSSNAPATARRSAR